MKPVTLSRFAAIAVVLGTVAACSSNPKAIETESAASGQVQMINTARGPSLLLDDVLFDFEKASLRSEGSHIIARAAAYLLANPDRNALVEGHTDHTGDNDYNQALSLQRSKTIKQALIAKGVDSGRITTLGLGETRPVADNTTPSGRQANRRVEIVFELAGTAL